MRTIDVALPGRGYALHIDKDCLNARGAALLKPQVSGRKCLIVTDSNVRKLYADPVHRMLLEADAAAVQVCDFPAGEENKNLQTLTSLLSQAVVAGLDRSSLVVALGGGVPGDTAGFMAATYMRGVEFIQVPTSLVAQVDSSIGGKTAVDLPEGKNLVGAFHQPKAVLIDVTTLRTLDKRQLRCGLAEVVKYGVILDPDFFAFLEANVDGLLSIDQAVYERVIHRSCELKAQVVLDDERETAASGGRAILNYGHTFGHAIETLAGYTTYTHGEAIAIGMGMAADLAALHLGNGDELRGRQDALFTALGLPLRVSGFSPTEILAAMQTDKKVRRGTMRVVVPQRIGAVSVTAGIPEKLILAAIGARCDT